MLSKGKTVNFSAQSKENGSQLSTSTTINSNTSSTPSKGAKDDLTSKDKKEAKPSTPVANDDGSGTQSDKKIYMKEAVKALSGGNSDAIIDLRVSINEQQETDLARSGFVQVLQDQAAALRRSTSTVGLSTFSNKSSIWIWRRGQGTCSGRLKPIIDIILDPTVSSDLVLSGYTSDPNLISGQAVWTKRAQTEEEEKDAIIDLYVTTGRSKDTSDPIWASPGVGWLRVDGNFTKSMFGSTDSFLWYRPARTRAADIQLSHPTKAAVALNDETRLTKLVAAIRSCLRHYVSIKDVKRLSNLKMDGNQLSLSVSGANAIRSERMMDFSALYHQYAQRSLMNSSKWSRLLNDVGLKMKPADSSLCFNFFDHDHNGSITIEEFTRLLSLTDYELDLALERARYRLLAPCAPKELQKSVSINTLAASSNAKAHIGVLNAQSIPSNSDVGKNKIKENISLGNVFQMLNTTGDGILSVDEIMDLFARLEIFITEEESQKVVSMIDVDGDDRIEERDFINFMRRESVSTVKKAFRIREAAGLLRRWLVRGSSEKLDTSSTATASKKQWDQFKHRYEKSTGQKFPGFLSAHVLQLTLANQGVRLSTIESRELTLVIAPEKNGRVHLSELHAFMGRNCRSFGELVAILDRDIFKDLMDAYRAVQKSFRSSGREDPDLAVVFRSKVDELKKAVEQIYEKKAALAENQRAEEKAIEQFDDDEEDAVRARAQPLLASSEQRLRPTSHEVISMAQLRLGLHDFLGVDKIPENLQPNIEEWASLAILVESAVAEGDIYGVRLKAFIEGICKYIYISKDEANMATGDKSSFDIVCRELKLQIYRESKTSRSKKPNYKLAFDLFDQDKNGSISLAEFQAALKKYHLITSLSDAQVTQLIALFDKGKRGTITFEDFKAFAEDADIVDDEEDFPPLKTREARQRSGNLDSYYDDGSDSDDDKDDDDALTSNIPPVAVTKNADCDFLAWHLYRQAYNVEPIDPEGIITELETLCAESEIASRKDYISVKEFWNLLFELKLQTNLTKGQFSKGILLVCMSGHGGDDDRVDYSAICKYAIRMGRSYRGLLQEKQKEMEKKFPSLLSDLKKWFADLCSEKLPEKEEIPRYEKIFRRLDGDHDGMLTPKEFRIGLRRLQYKDVKVWSTRMVRRLFDECDKNKDGLLSIKEFKLYVLDQKADEKGAKGNDAKDAKLALTTLDAKTDRLNLSDDEDDQLFNKQRVLTDHQLIQKVNGVLMEIVPNEGFDNKQHLDTVKNSVRRFFQRADPEYKGFVSEERFRAFLRRSGLQEALTASELRRLSEKLKRKGVGSERNEVFIDYEKLCQQLIVVSESIPKSKADIVFTKFQDAAISSATLNRSFMSLCSLVDLRLTGRVSKEEFLHISKMMDYPMTSYELESLLELMPPNTLSRDQLIDYRLVQNMLQSYTTKETGLRDLDVNKSMRFSMSGALPAYATPGGVTHIPHGSSSELHLSRSISTPLGFTVSTPFRETELSNTPLMGTLGGTGAYEKIVRGLIERIRIAVDERVRGWGASFSIRKRFENVDGHNSGLVSTRSVQSILEEIGIILSASELQSLHAVYGRVEDDRIFYDPLCRAIDSFTPLERSGVAASMEQAPYLNSKVLQRLSDLKAEGKSPRDMFEVHDLDRTNQVLASKFREVITRLQLLSTEHQLTKAMEDFCSIGNKSYINYDDFCNSLDRALASNHGIKDSLRGSRRIGIADGDGYDGLRGSVDRDEPLSSGRGDPSELYESLHRFKFNNSSTRPYPVELEGGSSDRYQDYALSPPKLSSSISGSLGRSGRSGPYSPQRASRDSYNRDSDYMRTSITAPRTSPSKLGSRVWGNQTPLNKKGRVPELDGNKWCCAVCLYVENPRSAANCLVCDSPNYSNSKEYQLKEQCRNCTFLNGQFAEECEMCGEPLGSGSGSGNGNGKLSSTMKATPAYSTDRYRY